MVESGAVPAFLLQASSMVDFSRIPTRHDAINLRLEHWAKWVSVHPQPWKVQPMFRQYRSHSWQWHAPELKMVAQLPDKHRAAIRWAYVFPWIAPSVIRRELALTKEGLEQMLTDARDMLVNRMRNHLTTT